MWFLGHIEKLDAKMNPKRKAPIWITKFNFLGLLGVCELFSSFEHVRNLYKGGVIEEGVVKELQPLVAKGVHAKWATTLLLSHYRHESIDLMIRAIEETTELSGNANDCPLGDQVEANKYKRFSTLAEVSDLIASGRPFPVLLYGAEEAWKAGVVVVYKKYWFVKELVFLLDDSNNDELGFTFHRVALGREEICVGSAKSTTVKQSLGNTGLLFWKYGLVLPDTINDTVNYQYSIVRDGWQYLDEKHDWSEHD
jgi:hypothetical protein